jgi:hypothetical protein
MAQPAALPARTTHPDTTRHVHTIGFFDWLFGGWQERRSPVRPAPPRPRKANVSTKSERQSVDGTQYRTVCVRLCDGFYVPISFATTKNKFGNDAAQCERQCPSRSRLFVYKASNQSVSEMVDLQGEPYTKLPAAFRFRAGYVADCTCHGNPWDPEAVARHQSYSAPQSSDLRAVASKKTD